MRSVLVLDYPQARPRRLLHALAAVGVEARLSDSPLQAKNADAVIVPDGDDDDEALSRGVPAGLYDGVALALSQEPRRPLLAVGFAVSLLLQGQAHQNAAPGLGFFAAPVQRFDPRITDDNERPILVPHVGRSLVVGLDRHPALAAVVQKGQAGVWLHFRHRLCAPARVPQADVAVGHHGVPFAAAIWRQNVLALQFLPELSGKPGLDVLRAWAKDAGVATRSGIGAAP